MDINSGKPPSWTTVLWTAAKNCRKCRSCTFRWNFPMFFTDVVAMLCPCCSHDHPRVFPVLPVMFFPCCSRHVVPTRCWAVPMLFQTQMAENQAGWTVNESMGILWLVIVMLMLSFRWLRLVVSKCFGSQFSSLKLWTLEIFSKGGGGARFMLSPNNKVPTCCSGTAWSEQPNY